MCYNVQNCTYHEQYSYYRQNHLGRFVIVFTVAMVAFTSAFTHNKKPRHAQHYERENKNPWFQPFWHKVRVGKFGCEQPNN